MTHGYLKYSNSMTRISWKDVPLTQVNIAEYTRIFKYLKEHYSDMQLPFSKRYEANYAFWCKFNTWQAVSPKDCNFSIIRYNDGGDLVQYRCYTHDDEKNAEDTIKGRDAYIYVDELFGETYGINMRKAFGTSSRNEWFAWIPSPINEVLHENTYGMILDKICKADYSSAYPSCLCGLLPDVASCITEEGEIEPTADYPFCFYSDGSSAEYNGYDLRKYRNHRLRIPANKNSEAKDGRWCVGIESFNPDMMFTYRMKASQYNMNDAMTKLYEEKTKTGDESVKKIMNSLIGYFYNKYAPADNFAVLAAVCLSRHVCKMCAMYDTLEAQGNQVIYIPTDCLVWRGTNTLGLDSKKELGKLVLEYEDAKFAIKSIGFYFIKAKDDSKHDYKHQGINLNEEKNADKRYETIEEFVNGFTDTTTFISDGEVKERTKFSIGVDF